MRLAGGSESSLKACSILLMVVSLGSLVHSTGLIFAAKRKARRPWAAWPCPLLLPLASGTTSFLTWSTQVLDFWGFKVVRALATLAWRAGSSDKRLLIFSQVVPRSCQSLCQCVLWRMGQCDHTAVPPKAFSYLRDGYSESFFQEHICWFWWLISEQLADRSSPVTRPPEEFAAVHAQVVSQLAPELDHLCLFCWRVAPLGMVECSVPPGTAAAHSVRHWLNRHRHHRETVVHFQPFVLCRFLPVLGGLLHRPELPTVHIPMCSVDWSLVVALLASPGVVTFGLVSHVKYAIFSAFDIFSFDRKSGMFWISLGIFDQQHDGRFPRICFFCVVDFCNAAACASSFCSFLFCAGISAKTGMHQPHEGDWRKVSDKIPKISFPFCSAVNTAFGCMSFVCDFNSRVFQSVIHWCLTYFSLTTTTACHCCNRVATGATVANYIWNLISPFN